MKKTDKFHDRVTWIYKQHAELARLQEELGEYGKEMCKNDYITKADLKIAYYEMKASQLDGDDE